jgi:hypothetical protein
VLLIFGFRTKAYSLGWIASTCQTCGHGGSQLLVRTVTRLSIFFIPFIPVRTSYELQCQTPRCPGRVKVSRADARRILATGVVSAL